MQPVEIANGILVDRGRILLGFRSPHRSAYPSVWDLTGGHVEVGESIEAALVRELREELDVTPTVFEPLATLVVPIPQQRNDRRLHIFKVTSWSGPGPRLCGDEHTEIRWHTLDESSALDLALPSRYRELFERLKTG